MYIQWIKTLPYLYFSEMSGKKDIGAENIAPGTGIDLEFETDGEIFYNPDAFTALK